MRKAGIVLFVLAIPISIGLLWLFKNVHFYVLGSAFFMAIISMSVMAVVGMLMAVTGLSMREMSIKWNSLRPWQRGVLGISFSLMCVFLFGYLAIFGVRNGWLQHS
jgi:hypothetical protein